MTTQKAKLSLLRKISVSTVNDMKGGLKKPSERTFMMRVYGTCRKYEMVPTPYGEAFKFSGDIRAVGKDGREHAAPVMYLPEPIDSVLANACGENEGTVGFGFDIFIVPDDGSERGYQYRCETLLEVEPTDPVKQLANSLPKLEIKASEPAQAVEKLEEKSGKK